MNEDEAAVNVQSQETTGEETLLTGLAGEQPQPEKQGEAKAEGAKEEAGKAEESGQKADPALAVPEKPEDYAFTFDKGVSIDKAVLGNFKGLAHELGINQTQAQKLAGFYANTMLKSMEAQQAALAETEKGWIEQIKADPKHAENLAHATRAMEQFSSPELVSLFTESRLGSHPEMVNFMVKVGKALAEPGFAKGEATGSPLPLRDRLWPDDIMPK